MPLNDETKNFINKDSFDKMKDGVKLLNFARGGLVDEDALLVALDDNKVESYVTDFPSLKVIQNDKVIAIPHLGASVNLPNAKMDMNSPFRITCIHENKPKMISQITDIFKDANIENLMNKSKKDIAYTIIDLNSEVDITPIEKFNCMIRVSTYKK